MAMTGREGRLLCVLFLHISCISFGSGAPQGSSGQDAPCRTSDNEQGTCMNLIRCRNNNVLIASKNLQTPQNEEYFRKNACGWNNNEPKICCPNKSPPSVKVDKAPVNDTLTQRVPFGKPADCGMSKKIGKEKVYGGSPAELGSWPWMVALGYRRWSDPTVNFRCGASLISNEWIVTAAHCVTDTGSFELVSARLGDLNLNDNVNDGAKPVDVPVNKQLVFVHPDYDNDRRNYDVALVRLSHPVNFTTLIQPICVFSGTEYKKDEYYKNKAPFIAGWGTKEDGSKPTQLIEVAVKMQELTKCSEKYSEIGGKSFTDNLLCAGEPKKDACQGDSGGPLMFVNGLRFFLGGIVSAGKDCGTDFPGLYMKVAKFTPWINQVTGINF